MKLIKTILGWISAILLVGSAVWYSYLVVIQQIMPAAATFILACVYFFISELTYRSKHKNVSIWNAIAMHAGAANAAIATTTIVVTKIVNGNFLSDFTQFHYLCLGICALILIIWQITKKHTLSFLLMQAVAVIAYLPMVVRVINTETQTESNVLWVAILIASFAGIPKAWDGYKKGKKGKKDWLSLVYIARAIISTGIVVYLVFAKDVSMFPFNN